MGVRRNKFYFFWSISFIVASAIAFAPKYWIPLFDSNSDFPIDIHYHALFSVIWIVIFFTQTVLISKSKFKTHQYLGYLSIVFAIGVIISGFYVSIGLAERALVGNSSGARPGLLINLLDLVMFGVLFSMAIKNRSIPIKHKRLIALATIVLLNAAYFRIGRFITGFGFGSILLAIVLTSSVIVFFVISEKKFSKRSNKKFWRIAIAVILIHIIRIPLAITPFWADIADFLITNF